MKIGFIGAGKTGNSLARHFASDEVLLSGFYSKTYEHARQAADYVHSVAFLSLEDVVNSSDIIFITTPDGVIRQIWKEIKQLSLDLNGKIFCHCSGSISSEVFDGIESLGAYGCAAHPMQAISSKYVDLSGVFFTLDGSKEAVEVIEGIIRTKDHRITVIEPEAKGRYHAAASMASNLMVGLADAALDQLVTCGFDRKDALLMLAPLMKRNIEHVCAGGPVDALTGPVERNDVETVELHLHALSGEEREIYRLISRRLVRIAKDKNKIRDYGKLMERLEEKS